MGIGISLFQGIFKTSKGMWAVAYAGLVPRREVWEGLNMWGFSILPGNLKPLK